MDTKSSRLIYVPSAISSFFEVCDRDEAGLKIVDPLRVGSRGGGLKIRKGTYTRARVWEGSSDRVIINGAEAEAKTTRRLIADLRATYGFGPVTVEHRVEAPIGSGFGTSGAGALAAAMALSDLFDLKLTLGQAARYAHVAEIESVTGLGTVTALAHGAAGAFRLVTEPGAYGFGQVDAIPDHCDTYLAVCVWFGPIDKSTVLLSQQKVALVNRYGRETLRKILEEPSAESLLRHSRVFAEKSGLASPRLLAIADRAKEKGAVGATQNMIGNAVHCLVEKSRAQGLVEWLRALVGGEGEVFVSELEEGGPRIVG